MIRKFCKSNKKMLMFLLFVITTTMYSLAQNDIRNHSNTVDVDIIRLINPNFSGISYDVPAALIKAIDKRFIASQYDFIRSEKAFNSFSRKGNANKIIVTKRVLMFNFGNILPAGNPNDDLSQIGHEKWRYYINDMNNIFISANDARSLISTIMPQAIESVDFTPPSQNLNVPKGLNNSKLQGIPEAAYTNPGVIRLQTRDISKSTINDSEIVYLVNDNLVVTRKVFEAINPVFIRSLKRITNPKELADYGFKDKKEIVKIDIFELNDLTKEVRLLADGCRICEITLVDNIQVNQKIFDSLNIFHIKEIRVIMEDDKKTFKQYMKLFPKEKLNGTKRVTVISL